ncbi:MAG: MGH1-like glycoside hydrolase domain-containing protein [Acidobacteriota bacterium]
MIGRFLLCALLSVCAFSAAVHGEENARAASGRGFPVSDYTPHGYIDNPWHSMVANRSGVIRSYPPLGFGFWFDTFKGAYGSGTRGFVNYLSLLNIAVKDGNHLLVTSEDFKRQGIRLSSRYHTKHAVSYDWVMEGCRYSIRYFLPREHTLSALVEVMNETGKEKHVAVSAVHSLLIGGGKWWGSNGLVARYDSTMDLTVSKMWAYGDVFALGSDVRSDGNACAAALDDAREWIGSGSAHALSLVSAAGSGPVCAVRRFDLTLHPHASQTVLLCLSRGKNEAWARAELSHAIDSSRRMLEAQLADDERFWQECPMLEGAWPDAWKHGWVYDFETLRMNVRRPLGIFRHAWDAMQVHSPRLVLGETALDMMTLSYADPLVAEDVLYGTFADAVAPNIPCVREDGSMNMISSDGSECGTAPMWGYPFHMIRAIAHNTADTVWVSKLYPHLQSYLEWWLAHRTDREGWLHCNNSWESGQDGSRRFLVAEHNEAAVADFVRTVDVEASMAEAMGVMEEFASMLGKEDDARRWRRLSQERALRTQSMFFHGWFHDIDARSGAPIILPDNRDVAFLTPLACRVARPEQIDSMRSLLRGFRSGHEWPPGLFTLSEAAWNAGERSLASEAVYRTAERVYTRLDRREVMFKESEYAYRIPGVANEFWPERDVPAGGENYGWGATLPMNILRSIVGFRESEDAPDASFTLAPSLPSAFMVKDRTYTVRSLAFRGARFDLACRVESPETLNVDLQFRSGIPAAIRIVTAEGTPIAEKQLSDADRSLTFQISNHAVATVHCVMNHSLGH